MLMAELKAQNVVLPDEMVFAGDMEATLIRFLRARKLSIPDTMKMIKDTIEWRRVNNVNELLIRPMAQSKMDAIRRHRPSSYVGFDKQGRPVFVDRPGVINLDKIWEAGCTDDDIWKLHVSEMEYMGRIVLKEASERTNHTVDSVTIIMDMSGLSMKHFTKQSRELFKRIVTTDSDNYPETNAGTYIVNASWVFVSIWKVISNMVDARTRAKVQVLGSKEVAMPILAQVMDHSVIPDFLDGGNDFDKVRAEWAQKMDSEISAFATTRGGTLGVDESPTAAPGNPRKPGSLKSLRRSLSRGFRRLSRSSAGSDAGSESSVGTHKSAARRNFFRGQGSSRVSQATSDEGVDYASFTSVWSGSVDYAPDAAAAAATADAESASDPPGGGAEEPVKGVICPPEELQATGVELGEAVQEDVSVVVSACSTARDNPAFSPVASPFAGEEEPGTAVSESSPERIVAYDGMDPEMAAAILRVEAMILKVRAKVAERKQTRTRSSPISTVKWPRPGLSRDSSSPRAPGMRGQDSGSNSRAPGSGGHGESPGCRCVIQ